MSEVTRLSFGEKPKEEKEPVKVYDSEQWAVTEREFGTLKQVLEIHLSHGMKNLDFAPDAQTRNRFLIENLQLLAEQSLLERCLATHDGNVNTVSSKELSKEELAVLTAKTQFRMGTLAAEEGMAPLFLRGVPSRVLLSISDQFIDIAEKAMRDAGVIVIEHVVPDGDGSKE